MPTATYEKIQSTTLGSASATIDFTAIGSGYTDLRLVLVAIDSAGGGVRMTYNSDTSALYSNTQLYAFSGTAYSGRETGKTFCDLSLFGLSTTPHLIEIDIFSYAGSTFKTNLVSFSGDLNASNSAIAKVVNLYRSTNAITSIQLKLDSGSFDAGTTATLYGILKA